MSYAHRRRSPSRHRRGGPSFRCEPSACDSRLELAGDRERLDPLAWLVSERFLERVKHGDIRRPQLSGLVSERSLYHERLGPLASWPDVPCP